MSSLELWKLVALIAIQTLSLGLGFYIAKRNRKELKKRGKTIVRECREFLLILICSSVLTLLIIEDPVFVLPLPLLLLYIYLKKNYNFLQNLRVIGEPAIFVSMLSLPLSTQLCLLFLFYNLLNGSEIFLERKKLWVNFSTFLSTSLLLIPFLCGWYKLILILGIFLAL